MSDVYIKKYWEEEDILFYVHYQDEWAVKQIELSPSGNKFLSIEENPTEIADQPLDKDEIEEQDLITKEEFDAVWMQQQN